MQVRDISRIRINHLTILAFVMYILLFDLVLGGSGNVFAVGPLSVRKVFVVIAVGLLVIDAFINGLKLNREALLALGFIMYLVFSWAWGVVRGNNMSFATDELFGYFSLLLIPVYFTCFSRDEISIVTYMKLFRALTILLSLIAIGVWGICFVGGGSVSLSIYSVLTRLNYGYLSYAGSIPRLFFKGHVFICIGSLFSIYNMFTKRVTLKEVIVLGIYLAAILVSFTTGFLVFASLVTFIIFIHCSSKDARKAVIPVVILILLVIVVIQSGAIDALKDRFSKSSNDGLVSASTKGTEFFVLIDEFTRSPIIGSGLGGELSEYYALLSKYTFRFEIMWLELLFHTGLVGFGLYVTLIVVTFIDMFKEYKAKNNVYCYVLAMGLLFLCMETSTNPFMNNAIGIGFLAICAGLANSNNFKKAEVTGTGGV